MANRLPRRQGVVYGPVRPPGGGRSGAEILGRLLGLVVIVLAVGVLGVGILALINERPQARLTPPPTTIAVFSPSPSLSPSPPASPIAASPVPTSTPVLTPTPQPTPGVTPFEPTVQQGRGFVTFGTQTDDSLRIVNPGVTFSEGQRMSWSAHLLETANSDQLTVRVFKHDQAAAGGLRLIREDEVRPRNTEAQIFLRRVRPANALEGPGAYTVQYVRGDDVLAEGSFVVEG